MTLWYLLAAVLLLLANGFFVAAQFALVAAPKMKIEQRAEEGSRAARVALGLTKEVTFMLAGTQLGITMASLGLGFVAEPAVARSIELALGATSLPEAVSRSISIGLGLAIVVFMHMVVGEMAPKNLTIAAPERAALWIAIPFRIYATIFKPFISLLGGVASVALRLFGVQTKQEMTHAHSASEIGFLIAASAQEGLLDQFEQRLLSGAVEFGTKDAAAVMIPRTEMVAIPSTASTAEIEGIVLETGLSRLPVYGSDLDDILGFFHAKDLLRIDPAQREKPLPKTYIRPMLVVPESKLLNHLLVDMRRQRQHFALVLDEHGGTAGVVTLEDVLEELVGDIRDEYDVAELGIETFGPGRFLVPGTMHLAEAEDKLGLDLPDGEYETIAGFLMDQLGRIPKRRDLVEHDGWRLRVLSMHRRRVVQVLVEKVQTQSSETSG